VTEYLLEVSNLGAVRVTSPDATCDMLEGQRAELTWIILEAPLGAYPLDRQPQWWQLRKRRAYQRRMVAYEEGKKKLQFETWGVIGTISGEFVTTMPPQKIQLHAKSYTFTKTQRLYSGMQFVGPRTAVSYDGIGPFFIEGEDQS
jgi:hypothetical protein